jgi:CMP-N-acetylneuraminic acid synthetase
MKAKIAALVPMRHHSQRVPGKNIRPLAGKPLFEYIIQTLTVCPEIEVIVVDTDSSVIAETLTSRYPDVKVIDRPVHLREDDVSMNEVLVHDTAEVEADFYLQTHSTNPLLSSASIQLAIKLFLDSYPSFDSLFSVTRVQTRLWDQLSRPINHNPSILLQTQDLPPVFEENSNLYIFTRETLISRRNRIGERPLMFEIDAAEALDIDTEIDFKFAEVMVQHMGLA